MDMIADDIRDALDHDPFEPFHIVTTAGDRHPIRDPHAVALMKSRLFIALPDGHWTIVPHLHVCAVETIRNRNGKPRRKR